MHVILGLIYSVISAICWCSMLWLIFANNFSGRKIWVCLLAIAACIGYVLALGQFEASDKPKQYPASEYRLSIKTTTIDNHTDTTYVITKIK